MMLLLHSPEIATAHCHALLHCSPSATNEFIVLACAHNVHVGHYLCVCMLASAGQSHLLCVLANGQGAVSAESPALLPCW